MATSEPEKMIRATMRITTMACACLAIALIGSGCILDKYTERPGSSGVVVDSKTGRPLPDAVVRLVAPVNRKGGALDKTADAEMRTGSDGRFEFKPRTRAWIRPLVPAVDPVARYGQISATCDGYGWARSVVDESSLHDLRIELPPAARAEQE